MNQVLWQLRIVLAEHVVYFYHDTQRTMLPMLFVFSEWWGLLCSSQVQTFCFSNFTAHFLFPVSFSLCFMFVHQFWLCLGHHWWSAPYACERLVCRGVNFVGKNQRVWFLFGCALSGNYIIRQITFVGISHLRNSKTTLITYTLLNNILFLF